MLLKCKLAVFIAVLMLCAFVKPAVAQFRNIHIESLHNDTKKFSFYSESEGYIAFSRYIGFTADSGRTTLGRYIDYSNVKFNGYTVNLTFGFEILGVKAFDKNNLLVYGSYAGVPAILTSADGAASFKLAYHSQYGTYPNSAVEDMVFLPGNKTGFAIDRDRILKTVNGGDSWDVSKITPYSYGPRLQLLGNTVYAASLSEYDGALYSSANGGSNWNQVALPSKTLRAFYFLDAATGWLSDNDGSIFFTQNGGQSWVRQNNLSVSAFTATRLIFTDKDTGYGALANHDVYKTTDGGKVWERLLRDAKPPENYPVSDMQIVGNSFWAGGEDGYIELSTNGGGTPVPKASFLIDTAELSATGLVKLTNYSKPGQNYRWLLNGKDIATSYNANYLANVYGPQDTLKLIVTNSRYADTATRYLYFGKGIEISDFYPTAAPAGAVVTINGRNLNDVTSLTFGGVPAAKFTIVSKWAINATVGKGATGPIKAASAKTSGVSAVPFTFLPPPVISSFAPQAGRSGDTVIIKGQNFTNITSVAFGGVKVKVFEVISDTEILAVLFYSHTGDVVVQNSNGTATAAGFKVLPLITDASPNAGNYGTVVKVTGSGFLDLKSVSIDGAPVLNITQAEDYFITFTAGEGSIGNVTVTTASGSYTYNNFKYYKKPQINSFSPIAAAAGESVTITGENFNAIADSNYVYFGSIKGAITAASATSITVTVPYGATYAPISVVSNRAITYSNKPFTLIFKGGGSVTASSFVKSVSIDFDNSYGLELADMNNDGKLDIISPQANNESSSGNSHAVRLAIFYKNSSMQGNFKFGTLWVNLGLSSSPTNNGTAALAVTDHNYDGNPDLLLAGRFGEATGVLRPIINDWDIYDILIGSSYNSVKDAPGMVVPYYGGIPNENYGFAVNDVDGDGQHDEIFGSPYSRFGNLKLADLDNDGKPDVVDRHNDSLMVYKNSSAKSNINFGNKSFYLLGAHINSVNVGDIDGDGKADIIVSAGDSTGKLVVFKNVSTAGNLAFVPVNVDDNIPMLYNHTVGDVDGDGKIDILAASDTITRIYKNISTANTVAFESPVQLNLKARTKLAVADMDNDGRPDIMGVGYNGKLTIFKSVIGSPIPTFSPAGGVLGTTITITGDGFTGATAVRIGGINVSSFKVNSTTSITAVVAECVTGAVIVETPAGTLTSATQFVFVPKAVISYYDPIVFEPGGHAALGVKGYDANLSYQWQKDGTDIQGATYGGYIATEKGSYTVRVSFQAISLLSDPLVVRVAFALPADNFKVAATGVACKGNTNGSITVSAVKELNYTATITSTTFSKILKFTTTTSLSDLPGGTYNVCLAIDGQPDFKQCFDVVVIEPKDLSVYSTIDERYVNLVLDGGSVYNIKVNDKSYSTTQSLISLPLVAGTNRVVITTDKLCQGIIEKLINFTDNLKPYPNPFVNAININLGNKVIGKAVAEVKDIVTGRLLYQAQYSNQSGVVKLDMAGFNRGVYILSISIDGKENVYKIFK